MSMSAHQRIRRVMEEKKKAQAQQPKPETPGAMLVPDFDKMTAAELKEYAKANGISISGLTKKDDIKARIIEAATAMGDVSLADGKPEASNDPDTVSNPDTSGDPVAGDKADGTGGRPIGEGADGDDSDTGTA